MTRREIAINNFHAGYNCAQAVAIAFADEIGMDEDTVAKLTSGYGGGVGRLREVCGAVTGMVFVLNAIAGFTKPETDDDKKEHYARIQTLAKEFETKNGSIVCRNLLGLNIKHDDATPAPRTDSYYKKRPCDMLVGDAAGILENYLAGKEND